MNSVLTSAVLTGDSTNMTPYIVLMVVALLFIVGFFVYKTKKHNSLEKKILFIK